MKTNFIKLNYVLFLIISNMIFGFYFIFPEIFPRYVNKSMDILTNYDADIIIFSFLIISISYFVFGFYIFSYFWTLSSKLCRFKNDEIKYFDSKYLSIFVLINQIAFILFYYITGYGQAGSKEIVDSSFKYYFVLFPSDYIYFIYYAVEKKSKILIINNFLYIFSTITRGWGGGLLFLLLFELLRIHREKKLKLLFFYGAAFLFFVLSPFISNLRFYIRSESLNLRDYSFFDRINYALGDLGNIYFYLNDASNFIHSLLYDIIYRFQCLSAVSGIVEYRNELHSAFIGNQFSSFLNSGLIAVLLRRFPDYQEKVNLSQYLTYIFQSSTDSGIGLWDVWATNPTILGWLIFSDYFWTILYIIYVAFLMLGSSYFMRRLSGDYRARDVLWVIWITLFFSGWFDAIQSLIQAQIIIIIFIHLQKIILHKHHRV